MRQTIPILALAVLFCACQKQFQLKGTLDPTLTDSEKAITLTLADTVYSTFPAEGKFQFSVQGEPNLQQMGTLYVPNCGKFPVAIEPGCAHVTATADSSTVHFECVGTPSNDLLMQFSEQEDSLFALMSEATEEAQITDLEETYFQMAYDFARQHLNTLAGNYVFVQTHYYLTWEQRGEILTQLTPESLNFGKMQAIYTAWECESQTAVGKPFTDFQLPTPAGDTLSLAQVVGQTPFVLIDFWASWCSPCRASMPAMKALYESANGRLQIVGVSLDNDKDQWTSCIERMGLNWLQVSDLKGWQSVPAGLYGVSAIPATVLLDSTGVIIGRNLSADQLEALINPAN